MSWKWLKESLNIELDSRSLTDGNRPASIYTKLDIQMKTGQSL